jgi:hypothetical protein
MGRGLKNRVIYRHKIGDYWVHTQEAIGALEGLRAPISRVDQRDRLFRVCGQVGELHALLHKTTTDPDYLMEFFRSRGNDESVCSFNAKNDGTSQPCRFSNTAHLNTKRRFQAMNSTNIGIVVSATHAIFAVGNISRRRNRRQKDIITELVPPTHDYSDHRREVVEEGEITTTLTRPVVE